MSNVDENKNSLPELPRVISIQSHVVHGYVGNRSAVFPLQLHGFNVDFVNSVQFSNHTGYGLFTGQVLEADDLALAVDGLFKNGIAQFDYALTGYCKSVSFLSEVKHKVLKFKELNNSLIYVCDPVLGDNGILYVPEELISVYRTEILPIANIITPNQFEAELLTEMKINTVEDAVTALDKLHSFGVPLVFLSSINLPNQNELMTLASLKIDNNKTIRATIKYPKLHTHFTGSGDVFSALVIIWSRKFGQDLKKILEMAISTMHGILSLTSEYIHQTPDHTGVDPKVARSAKSELRLIESKAIIENPEVKFTAVDL